MTEIRIGSVFQDWKGDLYRLNYVVAGRMVLNKIENGRITGQFKLPWFFKLLYKHREDLMYSLYGGLQSSNKNDNLIVMR